MNGKVIFKVVSGFGVGFLTGFVFSKKYHERQVYDMVDGIYAECDRQIRAELGLDTVQADADPNEKYNVDTKKPKVVPFARQDVETVEKITLPYREYNKPSLDDLVKGKDWGTSYVDQGETGDRQMTDQEFFAGDEMEDERSVEDEIDDDRDAVVEDDWAADSPNRYITEKEFSETCLHFTKTDVFYYRQDNVFAGEDDQPISQEEGIFDAGTVDIDRRLQQQTSVYVRCYRLATDFQIYCLPSAYHDIIAETPKERERRLTKRKLRD